MAFSTVQNQKNPYWRNISSHKNIYWVLPASSEHHNVYAEKSPYPYAQVFCGLQECMSPYWHFYTWWVHIDAFKQVESILAVLHRLSPYCYFYTGWVPIVFTQVSPYWQFYTGWVHIVVLHRMSPYSPFYTGWVHILIFTQGDTLGLLKGGGRPLPWSLSSQISWLLVTCKTLVNMDKESSLPEHYGWCSYEASKTQ